MDQLAIRNIYKSYGKTLALNNVTLDISEGVFGILGPNGAGKTTLMRVLSTLIQQDSGTISMGEISWKRPSDVRNILGYVPQRFGMYKYITINEALTHIAGLKGIEKGRIKQEIERVLLYTNLTEHTNKMIKNLSGGMLRRLGIAQGIMGSPRLLIVDEPTAGLDPEERVRFRNLLANLGLNSIVLLSTHIVQDVESVCSHVAVVNRGSVLAYDYLHNIVKRAEGHVYSTTIKQYQYEEIEKDKTIISYNKLESGELNVRYISKQYDNNATTEPSLEDSYVYIMNYEA